MRISRPSKLVRTERPRSGNRRKVAIPGSCGIGERQVEEVLITDLGPLGCSVQGDAVGVTRSAPLALWLGEVGPIAGKLKWAKGGAMGVAFDKPLDEAVVGALYEAAGAQPFPLWGQSAE